MGQLYLQRFKYRGAIDKAAYDAAWGVAFQAKATTGNWGNVANGITHHKAWGTAWGGYSLIEAETPEALQEYQVFHAMNYAHMVTVTFEPLTDLDAIAEDIAKG